MMDTSVAGRLPGMLPIETGARQVPETSPTVVAPEQSVRPSKEAKDLRNKNNNKEPAQDRSENLERSDTEKERPALPAVPDFYLQGVDPDSGRIYLQAVDPKTGQVYYQIPRPTDSGSDIGGSYSSDPYSDNAGDDAVYDSDRSAGLIGKLAYSNTDRDADDFHRVNKTA